MVNKKHVEMMEFGDNYNIDTKNIIVTFKPLVVT